jgi:ankyrin repeat protein
MSLPSLTKEAAFRALDRKCADPDSVASKRTVRQLAAESLDYKEVFLNNSTMWGHGNLVRCALEAGVSPDTTSEEETGSTPVLVVAAQYGATASMKALLTGGANMELADIYGSTALTMAAKNGHLSCVQLLLDAGANANTQDWLGNTPLIYAVLRKQVECARALLPASELALTNRMGHTALHSAVNTASEACFELLLPLYDVDVRNVPGVDPSGEAMPAFNKTALHLACQRGLLPMCKALLSRGADRMARDNHQCIPLHYAAQQGHLSCAVMLVGRPGKVRMDQSSPHVCVGIHSLRRRLACRQHAGVHHGRHGRGRRHPRARARIRRLADVESSLAEAEASAALAAASASAAARAGRSGCPCEWFVGDDERAATRYFVVQGSDSVASWRSNLAFDPVTFEDPELGAKVHRGVYEAACALYDTLTPLVNAHVARHGRKARLVFTGHSLGGSLATLLMLMLRYRRPELADALDPVYTVGAPSIFCDDCCGDCGADKRGAARAAQVARAAAGAAQQRDCCRGVLGALGLPRDHVRNVMMHLDIVPRAFACDYRLVQGMLRAFLIFEHPGLQGPDNVTMYSPAGVTLVLQPSEAAAQQHAMLPPGSGLYVIDDPSETFWSAVGVPWALGGNGAGSGSDEAAEADAEAASAGGAVTDARAALTALLNSPHPLDILADVAAYGPQGTVSQFHNPWGYARALAAEQRRRQQWRKTAAAGAGAGWRLATETTSRLAAVAGSATAKLGLPRLLPLRREGTEGAGEEEDERDDFEQLSV